MFVLVLAAMQRMSPSSGRLLGLLTFRLHVTSTSLQWRRRPQSQRPDGMQILHLFLSPSSRTSLQCQMILVSRHFCSMCLLWTLPRVRSEWRQSSGRVGAAITCDRIAVLNRFSVGSISRIGVLLSTEVTRRLHSESLSPLERRCS